ncbi:MAG: aromatic acid exporter family protein [Blautia sp.]|nr:aromatic acid exporter family protein [Lachnoclostridium sp.]MCM1210785.1 aromatic acid exporter family protein [Blautia sp.]
MLKILKISTGSVAAILLAEAMGLNYSASAGIITLLTIQDTTKETIAISIKRILAFLLAVILAYVVFHLAGYRVVSYGIFLFLFIVCCRALGLENAVSTNAVLVTHYLAGKDMSLPVIGNEALLLCIGAGIGTLLNLYMPGKVKEIRTMQHMLENDLRDALFSMSESIKKEDKTDDADMYFDKLSEDVAVGKKKAFAYRNNTFFQESEYFISYMDMREQQCVVLKEIHKKIVSICKVPPQAEQISTFIYEISVSFGESNNARELLEMLEELLLRMKDSSLPVTREEFEERAVLYSVLMDLQYFLNLKKNFADTLTVEQIRRYWNQQT